MKSLQKGIWIKSVPVCPSLYVTIGPFGIPGASGPAFPQANFPPSAFMIQPGSRPHSPGPLAPVAPPFAPPRATPPPPPRFPELGRTLLSEQPFVARIDHGQYVVLPDGKVTTPLGARNISGRIDMNALDLDFARIQVRNDTLHCDVPGFLEGGLAVMRSADPLPPFPPSAIHKPGSPSPLRYEAMSAERITMQSMSPSASLFNPIHLLSEAANYVEAKVSPHPPPSDRAAMEARREHLAADLKAGKPGEGKDRPFMPAIVRAYNRLNPGLNIRYVDGVKAAADHARLALSDPGPGSARYVCWLENYRHHITLDFRKAADGGLSMVGVDSLDFQGRPDRDWLKNQLQPALKADGHPPIKPLMIYTDVQKSLFGCGVFALGFAKSLWKDEAAAARLHGIARDPAQAPKNAKVRKYGDNDVVSVLDQKSAFAAAPAAFAKHLQSTADLKVIWDLRPGSKAEIVNDSGENLKKRRERVVTDKGLTPRSELDLQGKAKRKKFSNTRSADEKRLRMYDKGLAGWESDPGKS